MKSIGVWCVSFALLGCLHIPLMAKSVEVAPDTEYEGQLEVSAFEGNVPTQWRLVTGIPVSLNVIAKKNKLTGWVRIKGSWLQTATKQWVFKVKTLSPESE